VLEEHPLRAVQEDAHQGAINLLALLLGFPIHEEESPKKNQNMAGLSGVLGWKVLEDRGQFAPSLPISCGFNESSQAVLRGFRTLTDQCIPDVLVPSLGRLKNRQVFRANNILQQPKSEAGHGSPHLPICVLVSLPGRGVA